MVSQEHIDALLDADEQSNAENPLAIYAQIQEGRRRRQHAKDKAIQEELDFSNSADVVSKLKAAYERPYTKEEHQARGRSADQLVMTLHTCFDSGDLTDILYALARLARKHALDINVEQKRR